VKKNVTIGFVPSGLILLAWPAMAITSIAVFDSPEHSRWDEDLRYGLFLSILLYPVVWGAALFCAVRAVRRGAARAGTIATLIPYVWVLLPVALAWAWDRQGHPQSRAPNDRIESLHSPKEIGTYTHDPNVEVRRSAFFALGKLASHLAGRDRGAAVQLLMDGLQDPHRGIQTQAAFSLGQFGPDAEAAVGPLLKMAPTNSMVIGPLGRIGQDHPDLVVPALLQLGSRPNSNDLKSVASAVEAVRALKSFPNQAAQIVRGLSGSVGSSGAAASGRTAFLAQNYLNAWLDTITTLDPQAAYFDPAIVEAPIVAILRGHQGSSMPKSGALAIVSRLRPPTAAELEAVRLLAVSGDTAAIRKQAQRILDAKAPQ